MKTNNAMLTTGAALLIAGAAVVGGYYVDRQSTQTASVATDENYSAPQSVTVPPPKPTTMASRTTPAVTTTAPASTAKREPLREDVMDKSMVALKGTITEKKGNVLTMNDASGPVRVVVREDMPRTLDRSAISVMDKVAVGDAVTVYGTLRTNEDTPKVQAEAIYDPATKTLYHVNGDRPAKELTSADITSRYTPVNTVHSAKFTTAKVTNRD